MSKEIDALADAFMCLPGVGPRSAQRMAYHLLLGKRQQGLNLANRLTQAMNQVDHCQLCNNFCSEQSCHLCQSTSRHQRQLCVVEMPLDLNAIEQSGAFNGQYFVLMGHLSPLDGIGPEQLSIDKLIHRVKSLSIEEVIFALSPSVEGDATMFYLKSQLQGLDIKLSRLATGVPMGGELEFLDSSTIGRALSSRAALA